MLKKLNQWLAIFLKGGNNLRDQKQLPQTNISTWNYIKIYMTIILSKNIQFTIRWVYYINESIKRWLAFSFEDSR